MPKMEMGPCSRCGSIRKLIDYEQKIICYPCWMELTEEGSGEIGVLDIYRYEYIRFVRIEAKAKTSVWSCKSKRGEELGKVRWFSRWRQYGFFPSDGSVFNIGCLADIEDFIQRAEAERKVR